MSRESDRQGDKLRREAEKQSSAAAEPAGESRTSPQQFLKEVRSELRKVAWPDRNEVRGYTIVVLVVTLVLVAIIWGMDFIFREAVINTLG